MMLRILGKSLRERCEAGVMVVVRCLAFRSGTFSLVMGPGLGFCSALLAPTRTKTVRHGFDVLQSIAM